jgi:predicted cupin superfamily sugar epimerase
VPVIAPRRDAGDTVRSMSDEIEARRIAELLGMKRHPEGGWFVETFRAPLRVAAPQGDRAASTAIYSLVGAGELLSLHRVRSDEVWHHYAGEPVELHLIDERGATLVRLGRDLLSGERPQAIVRAGVWQAVRGPARGWALCGCTVAPGFEFTDWELPSRSEAIGLLPAHADLMELLTRA